MPPLRTQSKLASVSLADALEQSGMADELATCTPKVETVEQALATLVGSGRSMEATRLLAHALPRREAVWWACMCARYSAPQALPAPLATLRDLTEGWVRQPDEATAHHAMEAARKAGLQTPEAWAALAIFWSGASLTPQGVSPVAPPPNLAGTAIASAIALAAIRGDTTRREARLSAFLRSAQDIATGGAGRLPLEAA